MFDTSICIDGNEFSVATGTDHREINVIDPAVWEIGLPQWGEFEVPIRELCPNRLRDRHIPAFVIDDPLDRSQATWLISVVDCFPNP
jgi:hypothetical protein